MPPWGIVRRIDASHFDPGTAYMAVDYHLVDKRDPYLFKTTDFGKTWTRIDAGTAEGPSARLHAVDRREPATAAGCSSPAPATAFFYSRDDGKTWTQFKDKLPAAPVNWIEVPKNAPEVAVATYGRGLWILRDVVAARAADRPPRSRSRPSCSSTSRVPGIRTANGGSATFVFSLASGADVADHDGDPRRGRARCSSTSQVQGTRRPEPGVVESAAGRRRTQPVLRSIPPDNPHIWDAGRWQNRERPVTHWGLGAQPAGSRARRPASTPCA